MKLGIALSGGGMRGIAHVGVLEALEDNGIKVDIIGGSSAGSMVASLYAMGYTPEEIYKFFKTNIRKIIGSNPSPIMYGIGVFMNRNTGTINGYKNGSSIEYLYNDFARKKGIEDINQIKMPLVIPTVDISESKEYIITNIVPKYEYDNNKYITDISVGKAVRASSSFPAVFNVCSYSNHNFMDGGILNNIPVDEVRKQGADKVIAVKFDADKIGKTSNMMDIIMKTVDIMSSKISEKNLNNSDFIINIQTDKVGLLDVNKFDKCYRYGYETVSRNIEQIKKYINR